MLTYRELGFSLEQVRRLLDDPTVDALDHLRRQQLLLADRIARLQSVAALVARAVEARSMGIELDPHELREVFGDEDPTQHAEEAHERWGDTDAYAQSHARTSSYDKQDWLEVKAEGEDVERRFAEALAAGLPADDPAVTAIAEDHRQHIAAGSTTAAPRCTAAWPTCTSRTSASRRTTSGGRPGWRSTCTTRSRRTPVGSTAAGGDH